MTLTKISAEFKPPQILPEVIDDLGREIDEKLRSLSPEYRIQERGYHLPVPRVIQQDQLETQLFGSASRPQEIDEVLSDHKRIVVNVSKTRPDNSLAWVIAHSLLGSEIGGKHVIPIVVDGASLRQPKHTLEAVSQRSLDLLFRLEQGMLVLIIDRPQFSSNARVDFLAEEITRYGDQVRCIIVASSDDNAVYRRRLDEKASVATFNLSEVSLEEMAHFVQKNFDMDSSQAGVIALRLQATFSRFNLAAHPTYFAAISRQTLSALLRANKRAELIQLAVDGLLSALVADDRNDVVLSRTTRSRFLQELAVAINVYCEHFGHADLVRFASKFIRIYDFPSDPLSFCSNVS